MPRKLKKFLSNPWVYGSGVTLIGALALRFVDRYLGTKIIKSVINYVKSLLINIFNFFTIKVSISLWILILLIVIVIIFVIIPFIFRLIFLLKKAEPPFYLNYTEDIFDGVLYKWEYIDRRIENIDAFCPTCKCRLIDRLTSKYCPSCKSYFSYVKESREIAALIEHNINLKFNKMHKRED